VATLVLGPVFPSVPSRGSLALLFLGVDVYLAAIIGIGLPVSSLAKLTSGRLSGFSSIWSPLC